ncbi:MAG TPA: MlaD family protein [Solirubrobacterales bacterium]|nr:MlaD family protein [Solirubrobacterales bacterium]
MSDLLARLVVVFTAFLLVALFAVVLITSNPSVTGTTVKAEFDDVYPLLPGMHVRVDGAIAGSVDEIEVSDDGQAVVTMSLNEGTAPPRVDATAAVRQQDITGDSYVALEPGEEEEELGETVIPRARTIVAPRFDDLLDSFNEPVRQGLKLILVELGKGLERRGDDLNQAILALRPGLSAANEALAEVRSQNAVLRGLIADAESVTGQAAERSRELGALVDSLATTLQTTAEHGEALDTALEKAPQTSAQAETTLAKLADLTETARPLAVSLRDSAPDLERTLTLLGPFLEDARGTMRAAAPTLQLVQRLLTASLPTLREAPSRVLTAPLDIAAAAGAVLDTLMGEPKLQKALFSADGYGHGRKAEDDVGLGAIGVEEGDPIGYEGNDPERRFVRAETVLTCETFGRPIGPACLSEAIESMRASGAGIDDARSGGRAGGGGRGGDGREPSAGDGTQPGGAASEQIPPALEDQLDATLDQVLGNVDQLLDQVGGALNGGRGEGSADPAPDLGAVKDLLEFLTQ